MVFFNNQMCLLKINVPNGKTNKSIAYKGFFKYFLDSIRIHRNEYDNYISLENGIECVFKMTNKTIQITHNI